MVKKGISKKVKKLMASVRGRRKGFADEFNDFEDRRRNTRVFQIDLSEDDMPGIVANEDVSGGLDKQTTHSTMKKPGRVKRPSIVKRIATSDSAAQHITLLGLENELAKRPALVERIRSCDSAAQHMTLLGLEDPTDDDDDLAFAEEWQSSGSTTDVLLETSDSSDSDDVEEEDDDDVKEVYEFDPEFESKFAPHEMRCLALVAHNHMKPAMRSFVEAHKNVLKKFMLTGTNTTMTMLKEVFGDDPNVVYGPTCTSGPLGGDAELVSIMVMEKLGGCIFFTDPMSAHPHSADIECLNRQANVHNIIMLPNPATASSSMVTFRYALQHGLPELIPPFFQTLASPSVAVYKASQAAVLKQNMKTSSSPTSMMDASARVY